MRKVTSIKIDEDLHKKARIYDILVALLVLFLAIWIAIAGSQL